MLQLIEDYLKENCFILSEELQINEDITYKIYTKGKSIIGIDNNSWYVPSVLLPKEYPFLLSLSGIKPKNLSLFIMYNSIVAFPEDYKYEESIFKSLMMLLGMDLISENSGWLGFVYNLNPLYVHVDKDSKLVTIVSDSFSTTLVRNLLKLSNVFNMTALTEEEAFGVDINGEDVVTIH